MGIKKINQWEKAVVLLLNFDGWNLEWTGKGSSIYDAKGISPKGKPVVIEMKFRNKYYSTKMLEKDKYDSLMALDKSIIKIYFVNDPKGNYMYWLNTLKMPKIEIHISNIFAREEFRHKSMISKSVNGIICGFGLNSYILGVDAIESIFKNENK